MVIKGAKIQTFIDKITTKIMFKDINGNILCEDFQPTFKDEYGVIYISKINGCTTYYGLGEKAGQLNKKGYYTENYNTDDARTDDDSVLFYKTIPYYIDLKEKSCYGILFDNSFRSYFDMGKSYDDRIFYGAVGGQIQYYFIPGNDIKDVVRNYTFLTGRMEMPPIWSIGYHQSRYSYLSSKEIRDLVRTFDDKNIPLDVIYLDIDSMDDYKVMTFKNPEFSDVKNLINELKAKGINVLQIVNPGIKVDEDYAIYNRCNEGGYYTRNLDGTPFVGGVWPPKCIFTDFAYDEAREWWKEELKSFLTEYGISGLWNDMNEPAVFDNNYKTIPDSCLHNSSNIGVIEHREFHNRYGFEMSRCSYEAQKELFPEKRPFTISRATYAGGQRYSTIWTGDNRSNWSNMRTSLSKNANMGISGFSFLSNDVPVFLVW